MHLRLFDCSEPSTELNGPQDSVVALLFLFIKMPWNVGGDCNDLYSPGKYRHFESVLSVSLNWKCWERRKGEKEERREEVHELTSLWSFHNICTNLNIKLYSQICTVSTCQLHLEKTREDG